MNTPAIPIARDRLAAFCRKWGVVELSLFGSVLRDDFGRDSDVDVLVELKEDARLSLWDWADMQEELQALFGRKVDLVSKAGLRNPFRSARILATREVLVGDQPR